MRVLYFSAQTSTCRIRVKRGLTVQGDFPAVDESGAAVQTYEVGDGGDFTVSTWDGSTETAIDAQIISIAGTPDSQILRRVRRALLDSGGLPDTTVADSVIREAYADALTIVDADLYVNTTLQFVSDEYTGRVIPVGASSSSGGVLDPMYLSALAYATAVSLVEGAIGSASRYAVSSDSPAGRINTTAAPEALAKFLDVLEARYQEQVARAATYGTISIVDQTRHMTNRGYTIGQN